MRGQSFHGSYLQRLGDYLEQMYAAEDTAIRDAVNLLVERLNRGGILHTFGTGHSSLVAAEPTYRAGGLAAVNFIGLLPGRTGWNAAIEIENDPSPAAGLVKQAGVRPEDIVIVISHSGRSPLVLAVADCAAAAGAAVMAVTASGRNPLASRATLVLETGAPADDCTMSSPLHPYGSVSSILTLMLLNAVIAGAVGFALDRDVALPVLESVHADGGPAHNASVMAPLVERVPCWSRMPCIE
ncbi:MAG TPA: sugar isomerase domain-containing protein [Vicinamibacterales bacterium]|nr:sugar isomerase domain-containing protein [Vicinamibacterales bacterium]